MKRSYLIFSIALAALIVFSGCQKTQGTGAESGVKGSEQAPAEAAMDTSSPAVATIVVGSTPFSVEIAETSAQKEHGLMGRESLPENAGMWFVFDKPVTDSFWMKDTLIALDLIFVDENLKVVYVFANAVPGSTDMITSPVPYQYVLEVNAGAAAKYNIKAGDVVEKRVGTK